MNTWIYVLKSLRDFLDSLIEHFETGGTEKPELFIDSSRTSPNQSARSGVPIDTIVLHNTDGAIDGALAWHLKTESQVSAHYFVDREGNVYQLVREDRKAWHARQENSRSIGIEIEAYEGNTGMTRVQNENLVRLIDDVRERHTIERIIMHRDCCNTDCPKWVWPTETSFATWKGKYL